MLIMTDKVIKADKDLSIIPKKKPFYRFRVDKRLRKLRKELSAIFNDKEYSPEVLIEVALMIDTSFVMGLCKTQYRIPNTILNVTYKYDQEQNIIVATYKFITRSVKLTIIASKATDKLKAGCVDVSMTSMVGEDHPKEVSYSFSISSITNQTIHTTDDSTTKMMNKTYNILPSIFSFYIDQIIDGLKGRYPYGRKTKKRS